ncbi:DNA/RNA nuclease SfsA [Aliidiomarina shirensis]|uniref:Sugar fermentation stimulation protein homolog n=1 Tax=Aliidiomarina shirensis TaxID=1048642 RepID=A0A432WR15_9GAMM|nr:DNA/RNA nuclease SfsA [Aliidiomarina shirensis]RUO36205.1 DNA/RNA nuclease SfsA [Aliidiomarina shirensis]
MQFDPPLQRAILHRRYKRFLADVEIKNGDIITIHCPNTGAMTGCAEPGSEVWYSTSANPKRKYPYTWELTHSKDDHWICVNTGQANSLVAEAIHNGIIPHLAGYEKLQREVKYAENSRVDIKLSGAGKADTYIEIKSVTLLSNNQGYFPDAVSARGKKHLHALMQMKAEGHRAILAYAILHSGIHSVLPAVHIDPEYADLVEQAKKAGVEVLEIVFQLNNEKITCVSSYLQN